ncbi:MAG TPA: sigma-70 family RNA polymerase sigma factor [Pyrinomonadaceae bacterium]|nr:sigma-70 family RNA polymerase sigma factor [Pyrinomonadaceae bacterium]
MPLPRKTARSLIKNRGSQAEWGGTLISWIARGDEAAFRRFYDATNGLLFGLLLRILGHTQTAEDVLSELYQEVRLTAARFDKQNEKPLTWLIFMAHRQAIERLCGSLAPQSEISRNLRDKTKSTPIPDSFINITEQRRLIRAAMDSIPPLQQRIIELAFFSGMTRHEIAVELRQSPEAVEEGLRYAILQLFSVFKCMGFSPKPTTITH